MRIVHTSDWHLGHRLYGQNRSEEHQVFLNWLLSQLVEKEADALIIAGDIFDTHNPSAESTKLYYNFLVKLHETLPHLQTVVIGGNHDSSQRLDAPREVLKALQVHVVGGLPHINGKNWDDLYVPLKNKVGEVKAWVAAVPFLKASDLPLKTEEPEVRLINGVREVYQHALNRLKSRLKEGQGVILTGHCEMSKGLISQESERKLSGYSDQSLPSDIFTVDQVNPAYVALGHLHLAQSVSNIPSIRYSGAPLAFSIAERDYPHQIVVVDLEGNMATNIESVFVPQDLKVEMLLIPKKEISPEDELLPMSFDQIIKELQKLPNLDENTPHWKRPLLQVNIHSEHPDPNIKHKVIKTLKGKHPRLAKMTITYPKKEKTLEEERPRSFLNDIEPEEVFKSRWMSRRGIEPPQEQIDLFVKLRDQARAAIQADLASISSVKKNK